MSEELLQCYNKGCGKKYKEENNHDSECVHHPGVPVFHDALKGWSCCKKRSTDFTEFLNIPGCTTSKHNPIKPPEPEKPKEKPLAIGEEIIVKAPLPRAVKRPESDDQPFVPLKVKVANSLKTLLAKMRKEEEEEEKKKEEVKEDSGKENEEEKEDDEVEIGTSCKNKGCNTTYLDPDTNLTQCRYHPGFPIFHEGYKFWTCCQKRTSDFNEFLKQEGCTTGDHVWIETTKKTTACRYDWHQTGSFVIISIFAKACVPEHCSFEVNIANARISLSFNNGKSEYQMDLKLFGAIEPEKSSVDLLGAKAEIKLRKADPLSWAALKHKEK